MAGTPDPKPAKRIVDPRACHAHVLRFSACQLCGQPARLAFDCVHGQRSSLTFHHIVKRSQRGDDVAANGLVVCGSGTTGCHGDLERGDPRARAAARAAMSEENEAYVIAKKGLVWIDRRYPLRGDLYRPVR